MARHCDSTTTHHLAGSSVHVDLTFLRRRMPALAALLPYRVVVRGCPGLPAPPPPFTGEYTALLPGVSSLVLKRVSAAVRLCIAERCMPEVELYCI